MTDRTKEQAAFDNYFSKLDLMNLIVNGKPIHFETVWLAACEWQKQQTIGLEQQRNALIVALENIVDQDDGWLTLQRCLDIARAALTKTKEDV